MEIFQFLEKWGVLAYIYFPQDKVDIFNLNDFFEKNCIPKEEAKITGTSSESFLTTNLSANFLVTWPEDSIPVFFYEPNNRIAGLANANSKSLIGRVLPELIKGMTLLGAKEKDIWVEIGPVIYQKAAGLREIVAGHLKKTGIAKVICRTGDFSVIQGPVLAIIGMAGSLKNYKKR